MSFVTVIRQPDGSRRVRALGARIHHGAVGVGLLLLGAMLAWTDRGDFPWVHDCRGSEDG